MTDKVVIVTGGSRGIGRATAIAAAARGFKICVGYAANEAAAREVVATIEARNGKAIAVKCDVASEEDILALFKAADEFGTLGALVNNAGIIGVTSRVDEMSAERIQRMMAINITGSILCAREAVKRMSTRHGGKGGVIVNLSSVAANSARPTPMSITRPPRARSIPSRSGSAMRSRAKASASRRSGPGLIDTEIHGSGGEPDRAHRLAHIVPMKRVGSGGRDRQCDRLADVGRCLLRDQRHP